MSEQKPDGRAASDVCDGLGPLPEPVALFRAPYGTLEANPLFRVTGPQTMEWAVACFTEDQLRRAVSAERLRWEMVVRAYLTACDESWDEVCTLAAKHGVRSVEIGPKQAAGIKALAALREFCGPNVGANRAAVQGPR